MTCVCFSFPVTSAAEPDYADQHGQRNEAAAWFCDNCYAGHAR